MSSGAALGAVNLGSIVNLFLIQKKDAPGGGDAQGRARGAGAALRHIGRAGRPRRSADAAFLQQVCNVDLAIGR